MSAKLLKSMANGKCTIKNIISGDVIVYWPNEETGELQHLIVRSQSPQVDLLQFASIKQLRKSPNLKRLVNEGSLSVVSS
jgi:hypothetical protein